MDVKGKNCIVTGGACGIGMCYVQELLKNGCAKVAILDMNLTKGEELCKKLNTEFGKDRCMFIKCDVTKANEMEQAFQMTINTFKTLDILINNAGMLNDSRWELEVMTNLNGVVRGTMLGLQYMGKDKGGRGGVILNIASILGLQPVAGCPVYCATKHAVIGFTRSFAMPFHFNRTGVKMLTLCPGVTDTPLISGCSGLQMNTQMGTELERELNNMMKQTPMNVAKGMMHMMKFANNGTVWVCEGNETCYELDMPDRMNMRKNM